MTDELVAIGSYEFVAEAEIAQMFLRENGVDAFLRDQSIIAMDWLLGNAIGYVKLQVPQSQVETAVELLAALKEDSAGDAEAGSVRSPVCSSCGLVLGDFAEGCPACSEASEDDESVDSDEDAETRDVLVEDGEEDEEPEEHHGLMNRVRTLKKPIFWFWLLPTLVGLALAAAALVEGLFSWM